MNFDTNGRHALWRLPLQYLSKQRPPQATLWLSWLLFSSFFYCLSEGTPQERLIMMSVPLVVACILQMTPPWFRQIRVLPYLLFFSITLTCYFGLTEVLTGTHAEAKEPALYGLSFYTVSLAYLLASRSAISPPAVANPLLLSTGPILVFFKPIKHKSLTLRLSYFSPFIVLGVVLYQIISLPLLDLMPLIERTDVVSVLFLAAVFELFVYANFCGLSLMLYGLFGIAGWKIPLNFRQPFSGTDVMSFWRGWHTSLSAVLKVLFYEPLRAKFTPGIALIGVYLASATWHGITANFLLWGLLHALLFRASIYLVKKQLRTGALGLMLVAIVGGRMLFMEKDSERLLEKLHFRFTDLQVFEQISHLGNATLAALILGFLFILGEHVMRTHRHFVTRNYRFYRRQPALLVLLIVFLFLAKDISAGYAVYGQR